MGANDEIESLTLTRLKTHLKSNLQDVSSLARQLESAVVEGKLPPGTAADSIIDAFVKRI